MGQPKSGTMFPGTSTGEGQGSSWPEPVCCKFAGGAQDRLTFLLLLQQWEETHKWGHPAEHPKEVMASRGAGELCGFYVNLCDCAAAM